MNLMTQEDFEKLKAKMESNELYQKSKSVHKDFQYRYFKDPFTGEEINGQQVREEDINTLVPGQPGFDESTKRTVIYNFKDGVLDSENDEPAIQYPGHYEIWRYGLIEKVFDDGGKTIEYWKEGVPVKIETNE